MPNFSCSHCSRTFSSKRNLQVHVGTHHVQSDGTRPHATFGFQNIQGNKILKCTVSNCSRSYEMMKDLKAHWIIKHPQFRLPSREEVAQMTGVSEQQVNFRNATMIFTSHCE